MINLRMLKHSDILLWISVGLLVLIGAMMIFSCTFSQQSREGDDPFYYEKKQFIAFIIGIIGLCIFAYIDYAHLKSLSLPLYIVVLLFLMMVFFKGFTVLGAQRWISFGPISFQPSELSKVAILIMLAAYLSDRRAEIRGMIDLIMPLLIVGLPFLLIFKQPDLGTSIILFVIFTGMLVWAETSSVLLLLLVTPILSILLQAHIYVWLIYIAGLILYMRSSKLRWLDFISILVGNVGIGYIVPKVWGTLKEYQRARMMAFLSPENDPLGIGYHSLQAKIAIGSGGFFGKGFMHGTQTQLAFIPQQFTDFIFSAVGEELGFLGTFFVLVLFAIVIYRAIILASDSRDFFGSMLAAGIATMFGFQVLVNMGMVLGILPVVGVPLPFISFGGTALIVNLCAVGILQSISMRRRKLLF